jgi:hypothetical protein
LTEVLGARRGVDAESLLWAAAVVDGVDPDVLSRTVDVDALTRVVDGVAAIPAGDDELAVAAAVLVGVLVHRPFSSANAATGWLAATEVLARTDRRVVARPSHVLRLCDRVHAGRAGREEVEAALRGWVVVAGLGCPACGRRVYVDDLPSRRVVLPRSIPFELVSRCAFEHGAHDRDGRPAVATPASAMESDSRRPVVARGPCGSILVAAGDESLIVAPSCDDPPIVRVVAVGELRAGDLVGPWDGLISRSTTLGFAPADAVDFDRDDCIDLDRLRRALRVGVS